MFHNKILHLVWISVLLLGSVLFCSGSAHSSHIEHEHIASTPTSHHECCPTQNPTGKSYTVTNEKQIQIKRKIVFLLDFSHGDRLPKIENIYKNIPTDTTRRDRHGYFWTDTIRLLT